MPETPSRPAPFDLCAGHPALDLVNSLDHRFRPDGPVELLRDYADLLRLTEQTQLLDTRQARRLARTVPHATAERALGSARELREALASVLYGALQERAPGSQHLRSLEQHFHDASRHRELRWQEPGRDDGAPIAWEWGRSRGDADLPVWLLAQAASQLVLSESLARVRACAADPCRWLFLDTSKNHTRRWCNMKVCGNRMKARRFQARH